MESLRGRLESLSYSDHVDPSSASLVQKLLDDLVRSRQEFVQLKQQAGRHTQELIGVDDKAGKAVRVMRCMRLLNICCHARCCTYTLGGTMHEQEESLTT